VGYTGGTTENPTYHNLGDHAESVLIEYEPARIAYSQLLELFWASHDPGSRPWKRQYMSAIFYHDEEQRRLAERTRDRESERIGRRIYTEILPAAGFTHAEAYHQKFALRGDSALAQELRAVYPADNDFAASTAAARVNGYVAGYGSLRQLEAEIDGLGLSEAGSRHLRETVRRYEVRRGNAMPSGSSCPAR
jgi:peptide-methionine (S)-S-oxide reductase